MRKSIVSCLLTCATICSFPAFSGNGHQTKVKDGMKRTVQKLTTSKTLPGISGKKIGVENFTYSSNAITGKLVGYPSSTFLIEKTGGIVKGYAIKSLDSKTAIKYSLDTQGNIISTEVPLGDVLCVNKIDLTGKPEISNVTLKATIPTLNSLPGAPNVLLLDFDGETVTGTSWNNFTGQTTMTALDAGYTGAQMTDIWKIVAEDFAAFNVNVTTDQSVFNAVSSTKKMKAVITRTNFFGEGVAGIAGLGSFSSSSEIRCWVMSSAVQTAGQCADVASHELGHTLGLEHDGSASTEYYEGHGDWAPIMGAAFKRVSTWSKGDYAGANNQQDDLTVVSGFVGFKVDDHGNNSGSASAINGTVSGNVVNVVASNNIATIGKTDDKDYFKVSAGAGALNLVVKPYNNVSPNLRIQAKLINSSNTVLQTVQTDRTDLLKGATINFNVVTEGDYFIEVDGIGDGTASTGYTDYSSLGFYSVSGNYVKKGGVVSDKKIDGTITGISTNNESDCQDRKASVTTTVKNIGEDVISSYSVELKIDGVVKSTKSGSGSLAINASAVVDFGVQNLLANSNIEVELKNVNGGNETVTNNNSFSKSLSLNLTGKLVDLQFTANQVGNSMNWEILSSGSVVKNNAGVNATLTSNVRSQKFCLDDNKCYDLKVTDAFSTTVNTGCNGLNDWDAGIMYNAGDKFVFNGRIYSANITIWSASPATHSHFFTDEGPCPTSSYQMRASLCDGIDAWDVSTQYQAGDKLVYNDKLYSAKIHIWSARPDLFGHHYNLLGNCNNGGGDSTNAQYELFEGTNSKFVVKKADYTSPKTSSFCLGNGTPEAYKFEGTSINVFPNPVKEVLFVSSLVDQIKIIDLSGKLVGSYNNTNQVNTSFLSNGVYNIIIINKGSISSFKVVK